MRALKQDSPPLGLPLRATGAELAAVVDDGGGDRLDAVLALLQAAACLRAGPPAYGLPAAVDALEGWIAGAPFTSAPECAQGAAAYR